MRLKRNFAMGALLLMAAGVASLSTLKLQAAEPLASLDYTIVGNYLKVTPAALAVPKGVAGSIMVEIANSDGSIKSPTHPLAQGAYVEATLRGPSFPARRLVGKVNEALMLPVLNLAGEYQLDNIRLVDSVTGQVRMEGVPSSVPVNVFAELLISRVTSRPLTLAEIQEKGIAIDDSNFRAVEFEVGFVLDGQTFPIKFPVVTPDYKGSTEIIPAAELQRRLVQAQQINDQLTSRENVTLPPELEAAGLNLVVKGCNFELAEVTEPKLRLAIPPIPALMVIPGNIGYLNQFFSVQIFTENGAPANSGLSVLNLQAKLVLPPGADQVPGSSYEQPGDDPLRFARVGPNKIIQESQPIIRPGPDGVPGTTDDILRIYPRESGQAEFLVEGLREGLHLMNLELSGDLDGLASGLIKIKGAAAGSVLVRNPKFSLTFSHPRTVRSGEPYEAFVTVLNTSQVEANLVSVSLPKGSVSGATLLSSERVELGTISPGGSATARFQLRGERTGQIRFSNLTTGEDSVTGRFRLVMGVDERGVELSPDSIGYPQYVDKLPSEVFYAANRVLGQALSVYSAPILPLGVKRIPWSIIQTRVIELAEAGQRIDYGESLERVLPDLALDWQGARAANEGFDQIITGTGAGMEWRGSVMGAIESITSVNAFARLRARAADLAGRGEAWSLVSASSAAVEMLFNGTSGTSGLDLGDLAWSGGYRGSNGHWLVLRPGGGMVRWEVKQPVPELNLSVLKLGTNGAGQLLQWTLNSPPAGGCLTFNMSGTNTHLRMDPKCDGTGTQLVAAIVNPISELPPELLVARQIRNIQSVRPYPSCFSAAAMNYGTLLGVLFSKPMDHSDANVAASYILDNGVSAGSVRIQPGGRVALLNLRQGMGAIRPRNLTVVGISDPRGHAIVSNALAVTQLISDGVAVSGRVLRADGSPAANVPVTLTMNDLHKDPFDRCEKVDSSISQVFSDSEGRFTFDFILAGVPYTISATDTGGLPPEAIELILKSYRGGYFDRDRLLLQAASSNIVATLGSTNLAEALRIAETMDRALWSDQIAYEPGMQGQEIAVALRFRGRGSVVGRVISADGVSPAAQAAVNLFPDSNSRELGRGIFADSDGRFEFYGVPLGGFSVQVKTSLGQFRTVAGNLSQVGETAEMIIQLTAPDVQQIVRTGLRGTVFEADNITAHPGAQVFVRGALGVMGITRSSESGYWEISDIPVGTYQVIAISMDGKRKGERSGISAIAGVTNYVNVPLQGTSVVFGRVENSSGQPVGNALVAGGEVLVRTDANGLFTLTGVPLGRRQISAGLEAQYAPNNFPRLGSASLEVLPGITNVVVVRLNPAGVIIGQVRDTGGQPVSGINVAIPVEKGFLWTRVNDNGFFRFINIPPGEYIVSAPAPPVTKPLEEILAEMDENSSEDEIIAALGDAFGSFFGVTSNTNLNAGNWGYTTTRVLADGDTASADVRYFPVGTIAGVVLNDQAIPIGARVRLTGLGMRENGSPGFLLRGDRDSDPVTGQFEFRNMAMVGDWGIQAASPFYSTVLSTSGRTTDAEPSVTNLVMQFPPRKETHGRLAGKVVYPDGTPVADAEATTFFGPGIVNTTDANGKFDNQMAIPAGGYSVDAFDPLTGYRGRVTAYVAAGITNFVEVPLLGLGQMQLQVFQASGLPAPSAFVKLEGGIFRDSRDGSTDTNGIFQAGTLVPGWYNALVRYSTATTTLEKRVGFRVSHDSLTSTNLTLGGTGIVRGTFRHLSDGTPVIGARVAIGNVADVPTDLHGEFHASGIPLGTYRVIATDPVSGRSGVASVTLATVDQVVTLSLTEQAQGELLGQVFQEGKPTPVTGATITLSSRDGLAQRRIVTTGPDGAYRFPAVTPGEYYLSATLDGLNRNAVQNFTMPEAATTITMNLTLPAPEPTGDLFVRVFQPDGITAATNVRVQAIIAGGGAADVNEEGVTRFSGLRLGSVSVRAASLLPGQTFNAAQSNLVLTASAPSNSVALKLLGIGTVEGQVFNSTGLVPVPFATLTIEMLAKLFEGQKRGNIVTDAQGMFSIPNVPVGGYRLVAESQSLSASTNGVLAGHNQTNEVRLVLGASGAVIGRIVRANGTTPVPTNYIVLKFASQSSAAGVAVVQTDASGRFGFTDVPLGSFTLDASAMLYNGLISRSGVISNNLQVLDMGDLLLDEDFPVVAEVNPAPNSAGAEVTNSVDIVFNEAMLASTVENNTNAIYLRGPTNVVRATVALVPHDGDGVARVARLTPVQPLKSLTTYEVAVLSGERRAADGQVIARGPTDLVGRYIPQLFLSSFTTRDADAPQLVSISPAQGAKQVEPSSPIRLTFNEPLQPGIIKLEVSGPNGAVAGTTTLSSDGRILVFQPDVPWQPNRGYSYSVSNLVDLAGNRFVAEPISTSFETLDTIGPVIAELRLNSAPVAGTTVPMEAVLSSAETNATVRFLRELNLVAVATNMPYIAAVPMPANGSALFQAIATDESGNDGEIQQIQVAVVPNQPPEVFLARVTPTNNLAITGDAITFALSATDDNSVTNVTLVGLGGLQVVRSFTNGALTNLTFTIPATNVPGTPIQFLAQSTDSLGEKSQEASLDYISKDGTRPSIAFVSPVKGDILNPNQPLDVAVRLSDNSSQVKLKVQLSSLVSATIETNITLLPNVAQTNVVRFSIADAVQNGGSIQIQITATDLAGLAMSDVQGYAVPDITPPRISSITPTNGALTASLWISPKWTFTEAVRSLVAVTNVCIVVDEFGDRVAGTTLVNSQDVSVNPPGGLRPGTYYTNSLYPGIIDRATNAVVDGEGLPVPLDGWHSVFRTAGILTQVPSNNTLVVAGQKLASALHYERGLNAQWFSFRMGSNTPVTIKVNQAATNVAAQLRVPTNLGPASLTILMANAASLADAWIQPPINLEVRPRDADDDGDGWLNAFEADRGMNPFVADADSADFDGDTLTNGQERNLGTDPSRPDTDNDGLTDSAELVLGTNPLSPDTDEDGLNDFIDPQPLHSSSGIEFAIASDIVLIEGEISNVVFTATSSNMPLTSVTIGGTNSVPPFATLGVTTFTNTATNGIAYSQLQLRPLLLDAGSYSITLKASGVLGTNAVSGSTNITVTVLDNPSFPVTRWKDATNGNFGDASRWSDGVPNDSKPGVIDLPGNYTVTVASSTTIGELVVGAESGLQSLRVNGALTVNGSLQVRGTGELLMNSTINGPGAVNISSRAIWTNGNMDGTGVTTIASGAQVFVTGSDWKAVHTRRVHNMGTMVFAPTGTMTLGANAIFDNQGLVDFQTDFAINNSVGGWATTSTFNNYGTVRKSAGLGSVSLGAAFNNSGALVIDSGTFDCAAGGNSSGIFNLGFDTLLRLSADTHTFSVSSRIQGDGSVRFAGGASQVLGTLDVAGTVDATGGVAVFASSAKVGPISYAMAGSNGRLEFNTADEVRIDALDLIGTLRGSGLVTVTSALNWSNGTMDGSGTTRTTSNTVFNVSGTVHKSLIQRTLINNGVMTWTSTAGMTMGNNATLDNYGQLDLQTDVTVPNAVGGWATTATVNNFGAITKSAGPGKFSLHTVFNNNGTVEVASGAFEVAAGGQSSGLFEIAAGSIMAFGSGTHVLTDTSVLQGAGAVQFNSGTAYLEGIFDVSGGLSANGGVGVFGTNATVSMLATAAIMTAQSRLEFNCLDDVQIGTLNLNGTLRGSATVNITNALNWTDGLMDGTGTTRVLPGASLMMTSNQSKSLSQRRLINEGTGAWTGNASWNIGAAAEFWNMGVFEIQTDQNISSAAGGWSSSGLFANSGMLRKVAGAGANEIYPTFRNTGIVEILSGTLTLQAGDTNTGPFLVTTNTTLRLANGTHVFSPASTLTGGGRLVVSAGTAVISSSPEVTVLLNGGTARFDGGPLVASMPIIMDGGNIEGNAVLRIEKELDFRYGTMRGSGATILTGGATARMPSNAYNRFINRLFAVEGTLTIEDGSRAHFNSGTLVTTTTGTIIIPGAATFTWNGSSNSFTNNGTLLKTGAGAFSVGGNIPLYNNGTIQLSGGSLTLSGGGQNTGALLAGPGATLTFAGNYTHAVGSMLAGQAAMQFTSGTHDMLGTFKPEGSLAVSGTATLVVRSAMPVTTPVSINGGTLRSEASQVLADFTLGTGTLEGSGNLTITNQLTWLRGFMSGTGRTIIPEGATLVIDDPPGAKYLRRALDNSGTIRVPATVQIYIANGSLNNLAGATIEVLDGFTLTHNGGTAAVDNLGTILMTGTNALTFGTSVPLNNVGLADVRSGSLLINSASTNLGSILIASNALAVFSANGTYGTGSTLRGAGEIRFTSGTHNLQGDFEPLGILGLRGGTIMLNKDIRPVEPLMITNTATVHFNVDQTFGSLVHVGTALAGAGTLTITNQLTWGGGDMLGSGKTVIPAGGTLLVEGSTANRVLGRILDNAGTVAYTTGQRLFLQTGILNNLAGGQFNVTGGELRWSSGTSLVNNLGAWNKTGTNLFELVSLPFHNLTGGLINISEGVLSSGQGGTNRGTVQVAAGATYTMAGGAFYLEPGTMFSGNGQIMLQGNSVFTLRTNIHIGSLSMTIRGSATMTGAFELANSPGSVLRFEKNVTMPGSLRIGGIMEVPTNVTVIVNGNLRLETGSVLTNWGRVEVKGSFINEGGLIVGNAPIQLGGVAPILSVVSIRTPAMPVQGTGQTQPISADATTGEVRLAWEGEPGRKYTVQSSADMRDWNDTSAWITELEPGLFEASVPIDGSGAQFFRTRNNE